MSVYIHSTKRNHATDFTPVIRSDTELQTERENFRNSISDKEDLKLIHTIYETMRCIRDPEHPYTLEQLNVINLNDVQILAKGAKKYVNILWKPSFPTCGYATHIGLSILLKLERDLMSMDNLKIFLEIKPGGHKQKKIIDKQLNDKERVAAAKENDELMGFLESLIC